MNRANLHLWYEMGLAADALFVDHGQRAASAEREAAWRISDRKSHPSPTIAGPELRAVAFDASCFEKPFKCSEAVDPMREV